MKLKTETHLSYIDPLTVEFYQNNQIDALNPGLTEHRTDGRTNGRDFNTSLVEVIINSYFQ